jgi:hypothetical protein
VIMQIVTAFHVSDLQRYGITVGGNVTMCTDLYGTRQRYNVYRQLRYEVTLQCVPTVTVRGNVTMCTDLYGTR